MVLLSTRSQTSTIASRTRISSWPRTSTSSRTTSVTCTRTLPSLWWTLYCLRTSLERPCKCLHCDQDARTRWFLHIVLTYIYLDLISMIVAVKHPFTWSATSSYRVSLSGLSLHHSANVRTKNQSLQLQTGQRAKNWLHSFHIHRYCHWTKVGGRLPVHSRKSEQDDMMFDSLIWLHDGVRLTSVCLVIVAYYRSFRGDCILQWSRAWKGGREQQFR